MLDKSALVARCFKRIKLYVHPLQEQDLVEESQKPRHFINRRGFKEQF